MKTLPYARKQEILEMLKENEFVDVDQLSKKFEVSYMTINRDLKELEESGAVSRVYGGVKAAEGNASALHISPSAAKSGISAANTEEKPYSDLTIEERFKISLKAKQSIAKRAAELVQNGDVIAMDPSTTVIHMCTFLQDKNIIVITTSLMVALQFSNSKSVQVMMPGGSIRKPSLSVVGPLMEDMLDEVVIDKCFLSSHAISFENGLTDLTVEESDSKKKLLKRSKKVYVLVDN
ncbi:MAG: DeoR/GlpR family DNA-binding transcription regulator, partial [Clostridia bacterium]